MLRMIRRKIGINEIPLVNSPEYISQDIIGCQHLGAEGLTDDLAALHGAIRSIDQDFLIASLQIDGEPNTKRQKKY